MRLAFPTPPGARELACTNWSRVNQLPGFIARSAGVWITVAHPGTLSQGSVALALKEGEEKEMMLLIPYQTRPAHPGC